MNTLLVGGEALRAEHGRRLVGHLAPQLGGGGRLELVEAAERGAAGVVLDVGHQHPDRREGALARAG